MRIKIIKFFLVSFIFVNCSYSQVCLHSDSIFSQDSISTLHYAFVSLIWNSVPDIDNYRIRFKRLSDTIYEYRYAYQDTNRFPSGPWCNEGDWVVFRPYSGTELRKICIEPAKGVIR